MVATILGCGTSTGVPVIGCHCGVCQSGDPRNVRLRSSLLLRWAQATLVIDTGPDFRQQMLAHMVDRLDSVLYTHLHADHCSGFDDLRAYHFHQRATMPCHLAAEHEATFRERFAYAFTDDGYQGVKPSVELKPFVEGTFQILGLEVEAAMLPHGPVRTAAFRFGSLVYATDFKAFTPELVARWRGRVDTMVASGLHFGSHPAHSTIPETLALMDALGVRRGVITHLSHDVDFGRDQPRLPAGRELAVDGLTVAVPS